MLIIESIKNTWYGILSGFIKPAVYLNCL